MSVKHCYFTLLIMAFLSQLSCGGKSEAEKPEVVSAGNFKTLKATVKMREVPEMLRTRDVSGPNLVFVHVQFDSDNNGEFSSNDISFRAAVITSTENDQVSLEAFMGRGNTGHLFVADIEYEVVGDELFFIVEKNQSELLETISSETQVYVNVGYFDKASTWASSDYLPSKEAYTQVQNNTLIIDDRRDTSGTDDFIDIYEFKLDFIN